MAAFIIAGQANDPTFARAEYAAKQVEVACPSIVFSYEMKHPDEWNDFINAVLRRYDFHEFPPNFHGPVVWTLEGELIGTGQDFIETICGDKFGLKDLPPVNDPLFKQIAADNLRQVEIRRHREQNGPPLSERCEAARVKAEAASLVTPVEAKRRRYVIGGASMEVWTPADEAEHHATYREAYGNGQPAHAALDLQVATVGQEDSHSVLLHPKPLCKGHLVVVPRRQLQEVTRLVSKLILAVVPEEGQSSHRAEAPPVVPEPIEELEVEVDDVDGLNNEEDYYEEEEYEETPHESKCTTPKKISRPQSANRPTSALNSARRKQVSEVVLQVPPHAYRGDSTEDLSLQDFLAAAEVLLSLGGVATWMGLRGATEYRHPLDTHLQVMPFPLHSAGPASPLRYPLELHLERVLRDGGKSLPVFPFQHELTQISVVLQEGVDRAFPLHSTTLELANALQFSYQGARSRSKSPSCAIAFTPTWMLCVPIATPDVDTPLHEVWLSLPPPPPCALVGVVLCPELAPEFPETAQPGAPPSKLVSNRAIEEGIPEGFPEYERACREVRISTKLLEKPAEILATWTLPKAK